MDILGLIKDKLTDSVIKKVSGFLGEHPEKIGPALNSAVPIVLGGIIRNATNEEDTGKVMDVLKDGGHTGEILDDLPNLLGNFDKTQLLITIGSNIYTHFAGNKGNAIVEKLSTLNGIRKTSASSLVGLAAPLVLGALGKVVSREGLGVSGLTKLLSDQRESVFGALPPAIANQLNFKSAVSITNSEKEEKQKEVQKPSTEKSRFPSWIPWALISLLFLAGIAYFWKYRKQIKAQTLTENTIGVLPKKDSIVVNDIGFSNTLPADSINNSTPIESSNIDTKPTKKEEIVKPIEKKVEETKIKETPKTETFDKPSSSTSISDQLKNSSSWISLNTDFKRNSAEISSKTNLDDVAKFLKSNRKSKVIIAGGSESTGKTLAEDRAYAVREILLERGVNESQLSVQSSAVNDANGKVVIKIKK